MRALYSRIGLPSVWQAIIQLNKLIGQAAASTPAYNEWPFAEALSRLDLTLPSHSGRPHITLPAPWIEPYGMEAALAGFLLATPPYEAFRVFGTDPTDPTYDEGTSTISLPPIPRPGGSLYTFLTGVSLEPTHKLFSPAFPLPPPSKGNRCSEQNRPLFGKTPMTRASLMGGAVKGDSADISQMGRAHPGLGAGYSTHRAVGNAFVQDRTSLGWSPVAETPENAANRLSQPASVPPPMRSAEGCEDGMVFSLRPRLGGSAGARTAVRSKRGLGRR
jgi:hypothetical protein